MLYHEYSLKPEARSGIMVPRTALPDIFLRPDAGYCSVYAFQEAAVFAIRAQGDSKGLARFPVYSDRLWIDIDAADSSESEVGRVREYVRTLTRDLVVLGCDFTVWFSGSKGYHICIKITPMIGKDVPWSQLQYVQHTLNVVSDYSLYQHARLLSNPGRLHPKTGLKKHKVFEHRGNNILTIPVLEAPSRPELDSDALSDSDLARIALHRIGSLIKDAPLPGMRHQGLWSVAMSCVEAGMSKDLIFGQLFYANRFLTHPKTEDEIWRAVNQALHQSGA